MNKEQLITDHWPLTTGNWPLPCEGDRLAFAAVGVAQLDGNGDAGREGALGHLHQQLAVVVRLWGCGVAFAADDGAHTLLDARAEERQLTLTFFVFCFTE